MKIIKMKQVCLIFIGLLNFFQCGAMEKENNQIIKSNSVIKFGPHDWQFFRSLIQNNQLENFQGELTLKTGIQRDTIDFLCTQNKNIGVVRNEILPEQRNQIRTFLEELKEKESYESLAAEELKKRKNDLGNFGTFGFAKIFSGLGVSLGSTYICYKSLFYFENPLINFGSFIAGIISFANIFYAAGQLPSDMVNFNKIKRDHMNRVASAQGIMNFFQNIKILSEQNKNVIDKGAGQ